MKIDLAGLFDGDGKLDQGILRTLLKAIKSNYENKFDYLSLKQSIQNMKDMDMDEKTSFQSALATAATMGITKASIKQSAKKYLSALTIERESFASALKNQIEAKVNGKKKEAKLLKQKIKEYNQKIEEMKKDISIFQEKIDKVDEHVAAAKAKIDATKTKFEETYSSLHDVISSDIKQLDKYL